MSDVITQEGVGALGGSHAIGWRWINASEATAFATDVLLSPTRPRPVVALTTNARSGELTLDITRLARALAGHAEVVAFETGDATWALSDALPNRLDVYGGAARIWWPGLSMASAPYAHPLIMFKVDEAEVVGDHIVATVRGDGADGHLPGQRGPAPPTVGARLYQTVGAIVPGMLTKRGRPVVAATVAQIVGGRVYLQLGANRGVLAFADEKLGELAGRLAVGQVLPAFVTDEAADGTLRFSTQGLLPGPDPAASDCLPTNPSLPIASQPSPRAPVRPSNERAPVHVDPWQRLDEEYRVGDVVRGRVCSIRDRYVLVELLPGAALLCHIGELDERFVDHPGDVVALGERVHVEILSLDPARRRGDVSIKRAGMSDPRPAISPGPGQPIFLPDENDEVEQPSEVDAQAAQASRRHATELLEELNGALADRAELMKRLKTANEQVVELRKELRGAEDRYRALEARGAGDLDPSSSETAFLTAVRVEYARRCNESDRALYPLQRMHVGREFLSRLRALDGISVEKVVEVCTLVACMRAHEVAAREVHELRGGEGGASVRIRDRDNAKAWRCSLQVNTASARRLHWWDIPGKDGRTIEFASVAVHDDFTIP